MQGDYMYLPKPKLSPQITPVCTVTLPKPIPP